MKTILILLLLVVNCMYHRSALLDSSGYSANGAVISEDIVLRKIELAGDTEYDRSLLEMTLKANLKNTLEETKMFKSVRYYNKNDKEGNTKIIDIKFSRFENQMKVHPLYFPLAMLTLSIYIWVGGPIVTYESNYAAEVNVYNEKSDLIKTINKQIEISENENIYNGWSSRRKRPEQRFYFIASAITDSLL